MEVIILFNKKLIKFIYIMSVIYEEIEEMKSMHSLNVFFFLLF